MRVHTQAQIGDGILDLLSLIEGESAVDAVRDFPAAEFFLETAALAIGAVQDGHLAEGQVLLLVEACEIAHDGACLVDVAVGEEHLDEPPLVVAAEYLLGYLAAVVLYEAAGSIHDGLGGAVVLLQLEEPRPLVSLLEVQDIVYLSPSETVDALCIVAHHADALAPLGQLQHYLMLGVVGVLVLVHQYVVVDALVLVGHLGVVMEEQPRLQQQVIEVHGVGLLESGLVLLIYMAHGRHVACLVGVHE